MAIIYLFFIFRIKKSNYEVRFESIDAVKGSTETLFLYQLRLLGRNRMINGTLIFLEDLDETFDVLFESHAFKNGYWVKGIVNAVSKPCEFFNRYYISFFLVKSTESIYPLPVLKCVLFERVHIL